MSNLVVLFIHFLVTLARLLGPGGVRSIVAESLILKHQLLIVTRSRVSVRRVHLDGFRIPMNVSAMNVAG